MDNLPSIRSFPKIFHIGENYISNLFKGEVEITEKIDGSQFNFGIDKDGQIVFRSKGEILTHKAVPGMFEKAKEQVDRVAPILEREWKKWGDTYFYCEFLSKPHHNVLTYERIPKNNLYLFGVKIGEEFVSNYKDLWNYADLLEFERVNVLYTGEIKNVKELEKLLENDSILGNEKVEGIVAKNYNYPAEMKSYLIMPCMGKYVREEFKERHKTEWKGTHTSKGKLELFMESFRSEARWLKAIQHLKELDKLENAPRDIGALMKEIERDLFEEEEENIKEKLFKIFKDSIIRKARAGFAEWYKGELLKRGFKDGTKVKNSKG